MTGQRPGLGIALARVIASCFAVSDTMVKYLGAIAPVLLLFARGGWLIVRHVPDGDSLGD